MLVVRLLPTAVVIAGAKQTTCRQWFWVPRRVCSIRASVVPLSDGGTWSPTPSADVAEAMLAPAVGLVFHTTVPSLSSTLHGKTSGGGRGHRTP